MSGTQAPGFIPLDQVDMSQPQAAPAPGFIPMDQITIPHPAAPASGNFLTDAGRFAATAGINGLSALAAGPNMVAQGIDWLGRHTVGDPGLSTMTFDRSTGNVSGGAVPGQPQILPDYNTVRNGLFNATGATEYQPTTLTGSIGLGAASAVPAVLAGGGISSLARAAVGDLPAAGAALTQTASTAIPAAAAGAGGEAGKEMWPSHPIIGAAIGGLAGGGVTAGLGNAALGVTGTLGGGALAPEDAALAQKMQQLGIPLGVAQVAGKEWVSRLVAQTGKLPFSGAAPFQERQLGSFGKALASQFGEDAERITPEVLNNASTRIGGVFDGVAARTKIPMDNNLMTGLQGVVDNAGTTMSADSIPAIRNQAMNIVNTAANNGGDIGGQAYQDLTKRGGPIDSMIQSSDGGIRAAGSQFRTLLDSALQQNAAPADVMALGQARAQWKALQTTKAIMSKADTVGGPTPSTGVASPAAALASVNKNYPLGRDYAPGSIGDNMRTLAAGGQRFLKEPSTSGSAENLGVMHLLALGGLGGGGEELGLGHLGSLGAGLGVGVGNVLLQRAMRNQWLARMAVNSSMNPGGPRLAMPLAAQAPFALAPPVAPQQSP